MFIFKIILVTLTLSFSCGEIPTDSQAETEQISVTNVDTNNTAKFSTDLLRAFPLFQDNLILSPFSIKKSMGIVALGAQGKTLEELSSLLCCKPNEEEPTQLLNLYSTENPSIQDNTAIFCKNNIEITADFNTTIENNPNIRLELLSNKKTDCPDFDIDMNNIQCVIHNAFRFSKRWKNPFDSTCSAIFHLTKNKDTLAIFMSQTSQLQLTELNDECYGFTLPFSNAKDDLDIELSMIFLVPHNGDSVNLIKNISGELLIDWIQKIESVKPQKIALFLPRFSIQNSLKLKSVLQTMGMKEAFETNADFSGMVKNSKFKIDEIIHTTKIDVDEYGVDAKAETTILFGSFGLSKKPEKIYVNCPFLYLIYDKTNRQILFLGQCVNPTEEGIIVPLDNEKSNTSKPF
jgi:serine protease inhibitor